ncbi:MAG: four helix bundle protein [Planctomycetia bacterium]|jgi:four helix bundle protein|nr:four helix bundle protein [Planctomycetia bacterium]
MAARVVKHTDLKVYQRARAAARQVFEVSKKFPKSEQYSLTDQIRRCSRSVCGNIAEAWRKRRYPASFVSKLNDSEGEAAETQVWLEFAVECKYIERDAAAALYGDYDAIIGMLVTMINKPENWSV